MFLLKARRTALILAGLIGVGMSVLAMADSLDSIEDRIAPIGDVCMAGDPCAAPKVASGSAEPRDGETVYNGACVSCHATGAAGAPLLGAAEWETRLADKGLDTLYVHVIDGYNAMPAKGLCMDCSDDEIKAAVDYMLVAK